MKRILIIDGHPDPDPKRFVHALAAAYAAGGQAAGHDVEVIRVADMDFPLLRSNADFYGGVIPGPIQQALESLNRCDHLVILYPLWLGTMPALLKGFFEHMFRRGVAYSDRGEPGPAQKVLRGKSARIIVTLGMNSYRYQWLFGALGLRALKRHVLVFLGLAPIRVDIVGSIASMSDAQRAAVVKRMQSLGERGD